MKSTIAQLLLEKQAVKIQPNEPFTWTSGIKSPIYCDNRLLISYPDAINTVTLAFKELLNSSSFDVIAGTATAGIPWAAFLAYELDKPMIYVRSKPKEHGTKSQIEGVVPVGKKVLIVEDLVSTGKSSIAAVKAVRDEGGKVDQVVSIFQYGFPVAGKAFAEANCKLDSLTNFPVLLEELEDLNETDKAEILSFSQDPQNWRK
jgi:orotate phosphoribosyltransferase